MLEKLVAESRRQVSERKNDREYVKLIRKRQDEGYRPLQFKRSAEFNTIIAEIKPSSPSRGHISSADVEKVALEYAKAGAMALSVLTEEKHFGGSLASIEKIRPKVSIPLMRKDFIVDRFQVDEALAYNADGVLLMVSVLGAELAGLLDYCNSKGMWALVETHTGDEIKVAVDCGAKMIGVNNRDLRTLKVDLKTSINLSQHVPEGKLFVVESGIEKPDDIRMLKEKCQRKPDAFLVGTALMISPEREKLLSMMVRA
ncbi:MAG: indole-3-glycerol-phosphate synthase [Candidatus Altiarchaeota archaeon]